MAAMGDFLKLRGSVTGANNQIYYTKVVVNGIYSLSSSRIDNYLGIGTITKVKIKGEYEVNKLATLHRDLPEQCVWPSPRDPVSPGPIYNVDPKPWI